MATDKQGISHFTYRSRKAPEVNWGVSWEQSESYLQYRKWLQELGQERYKQKVAAQAEADAEWKRLVA